MFGYNEHHKSHLHHMLFSDLTKIFMFRSIFSFAQNLVFVFVPIFLYNQGIDLINIILYSIGIYLTVLVFDPIVVKLINRIGFKKSLLFSMPFSIFNFYLIQLVTEPSWLLYLAAVMQGVHLATFFTVLNTEIATHGHNNKRGNEIGNLNIILTLVATFSSLIGGLILTYYNFEILLVLFFVLSVIATIPLLSSKEIKLDKIKFGYKDYLRFLKTGDKHVKIFHLNEGADVVFILYVWPIALYLLTGSSFTNLGLLLTGTSLLSVAIIFFFKKKLDKNSKSSYLKTSAKFISLEYLLKVLTYVISSYLIYFVEILRKINRNIFSVSVNSIYFNNAKTHNYLDYILYCDFYGRVGRIIFGFLLIGVFLIFGQSEQVMFLSMILGIFISIGLHFYKEL